jgi:hypothetical protein
MTDQNKSALSRRRFLQAGTFTTTALGMPPLPGVRPSEAVSAQGDRPNFLILMCDEMRFPPI